MEYWGGTLGALMFFAGIAAVLFSYRGFEYWGGTLLEVAVLAGIGVDLSSYRGLVVYVVVLARRRSRGRQGRR